MQQQPQQQYQREQYNEIDLIQLIRVAFGRPKLIAIITVAAMVLGVLFGKFYYNKSKGVYNAPFYYYVIGQENETYVDGSKFDMKDLVSLENLQAAQASDASFASIDIEDMYEFNNIELITNRNYDSNTKALLDITYTLSMKQKYFDDKDQAKAFAEAVINQPLEKNEELVLTAVYDNYLQLYDEAENLDYKLSYLRQQLSYLDGKYEELIDYYGDITLSDGETISEKKKALDVYFTNNPFSLLEYEKKTNGYVSEDDIERLEIEKAGLEQEYKYNALEIEMLKESATALTGISIDNGSGMKDVGARITELISRNVDITESIEILDKKMLNIGASANDTYLAKMNERRDVLDDFTEIYRGVIKECLQKESKVFYTYTSVVKGDGSKGLIFWAGVSCILGVFCACCLNCVIDWRRIFDDWRSEVPRKK